MIVAIVNRSRYADDAVTFIVDLKHSSAAWYPCRIFLQSKKFVKKEITVCWIHLGFVIRARWPLNPKP